MIDSDKLQKNYKTFLDSHPQALNVLRKANGKRTYKEIAKELGMPATKVSSLLSQAKKYEFVKKEKGLYKKVPGILGFAPKRKISVPEITSPKKSFKQKTKKAKSVLERDAWKNAEIYPSIYILENKLRELILRQLGANETWWKKPAVTQKILDYAKKIKDDENETPWIAPKCDHPVYYVTLKHLCKIIRQNWPKFKKLGEQNIFLARFTDLYPIRNSLAHNVALKSRDKKEVEISTEKIYSIIKAKYNL
jgi:DNA-binding Lrp family transcriptional regulator